MIYAYLSKPAFALVLGLTIWAIVLGVIAVAWTIIALARTVL